MDNIQIVREGDWQALESNSKPVFVDFWAAWCVPCRTVAPAFEKLAERYGNAFHFAKVDVDDLPDLAGKFGVRSIPTLLLLKDGKVVNRVVGARSYDELAKLLESCSPAPAKI